MPPSITGSSHETPRVPLEVTYRREQDGSGEVMVLAGDVDCANEQVLEPILEAFAFGAGDVRIDASAVTFIDATGLRLLDHLARCVRPLGKRLVIECASRPVLRVWEIARREPDAVLSDAFVVQADPEPTAQPERRDPASVIQARRADWS